MILKGKETMEKFIIGVGTQRSGTTLLYDLLSQLQEIDKGPKEIHYFDNVKKQV